MEYCLPLVVGFQCHCREHFTIVVNAESDVGAGYGFAFGIIDSHYIASRFHIVADDIDFCEAGGTADYVFRSAVVAEYERVHQHCPGRRLIEPGHIEFRFRLASAEE